MHVFVFSSPSGISLQSPKDAYLGILVYRSSWTLLRFVKFTEHPWRTHATAKGDTLFPSPLAREECYSNLVQFNAESIVEKSSHLGAGPQYKADRICAPIQLHRRRMQFAITPYNIIRA